MTQSTVTRLRPGGQPRYTDTAALNDIHALLTATSRDSGQELIGDITAVLVRTGRPMVRGRHIDTSLTESPTGWPIGRVEAEDTSVIVRQEPSGPGLRIEVTTRIPAEADQLIVTLDGRCLHHPCPHGGPAA